MYMPIQRTQALPKVCPVLRHLSGRMRPKQREMLTSTFQEDGNLARRPEQWPSACGGTHQTPQCAFYYLDSIGHF